MSSASAPVVLPRSRPTPGMLVINNKPAHTRTHTHDTQSQVGLQAAEAQRIEASNFWTPA